MVIAGTVWLVPMRTTRSIIVIGVGVTLDIRSNGKLTLKQKTAYHIQRGKAENEKN